jgi:hypothetical protein
MSLPNMWCRTLKGYHLCRSIMTVFITTRMHCCGETGPYNRTGNRNALHSQVGLYTCRFGLHSGVLCGNGIACGRERDGRGNYGTCVSSVFDPHTGLQQCPICSNLDYVGMQCPASNPVCCSDERCVKHATQCTCIFNHDCPQGMCCSGNRRTSTKS